MKLERTGEAGGASGRDLDAGESLGDALCIGDSTEALGCGGPVMEHRDAVTELFRQHNRALVSFLLTRLPSEQEARDVAQEAYVRLLQLDRPGAVSFLRGYLFRIAANLSVDRLRHRVIREQITVELFEELSDEGRVERQTMSRQDFEVVCRALDELPEKPRRAFILHFVEGYSTPEVASDMAIDERTVRKYVTRALVHCRQRLSGSKGEGR